MNSRIGSKNNLKINLTALCIVLLASALRLYGYVTVNVQYVFLTRIAASALYILFFFLWAVSLNRRIIHKQVRLLFIVIACMEMLWMFIRAIRRELPDSFVTASRYCWYLYYLPMLVIPAVCLILSVSMGKPEQEKPKRFLWVFPLISIAFFLLVLTNDIHSFVFYIPPGPKGMEVGFYSYRGGYFIIVTYIGLCALAGYGIILSKSRVRNGKFMHFLPLIPLGLGTAAFVLYGLGLHILFKIYHLDISMMICLTTTCTLEACIQSGLILTNNGYDELFKLCGISALITDKDLHPVISSESYSEITSDNLNKAKDEPVMLDKGLRLSSAAIKNGYVFWQDDISELDKVLRELSEINDYLAGKNSAIQQAYAYRKKERQLIEKNRLYNIILAHTKPEIELYADLIEQLDRETDKAREKEIAVKIAFVSTFIKRRDNLIFLSEEDKPIAPAELYY